MSKALFAIIALFAVLAGATNLRIADNELQVGNNGQITLTYVAGAGYTVPVDFSRNSPVSRNMVLALYTSKTILVENCFQFGRYDCAQFSFCRKDNSRSFSATFPQFTATGNLINTNAFVDYNNWILGQNSPSLVATFCQAPLTQSYGANTFGFIGLGFADGAQANFQNMVSNFNIFFSQGAFRLKFNDNLNFRKNLIAKVRTDANWKVANIASIALGTMVNRLSGVSAIFDINSDSIGLPQPLFNTFLPAFNNVGVQCQQGVNTQPICRYNGLPNQLPNIAINDGSANILITPQMYALNFANGQFKLNFRALSVNLQGINYVTQEYQNTIILGNTVMGTYYTHFNLNERAVSLYQVL